VPEEAFAYYDASAAGRRLRPGEYEVQVGASSADIRLTGRVRIE
jgi:hypothetical protein